MYVIFHREIAGTVKVQDLEKRQEKGARTSFWWSLGSGVSSALPVNLGSPARGLCSVLPLGNTWSPVRSVRPHSESK